MSAIYPIRLGFMKSFLIKAEIGYVLIDAGYPNKEQKLWDFLKKKKINPEEIKIVIVTHGHFDHFGSLAKIVEKTKAKIIVHENDQEILKTGKSGEIKIHTRWGKILEKLMGKRMRKISVTPINPDIVITDNYFLEEHGINGKIIHTPGHTNGSISVVLNSKIAFIGDLTHGFPLRSKTNFPFIAENLEEVFQSWKKLLDEGVELFYQSHGKEFRKELLLKRLKKRK
ncbi:MAG: MBL fold metallo-hydrolase [Candidatus Heimdallarchaeaceae archaeon]